MKMTLWLALIFSLFIEISVWEALDIIFKLVDFEALILLVYGFLPHSSVLKESSMNRLKVQLRGLFYPWSLPTSSWSILKA